MEKGEVTNLAQLLDRVVQAANAAQRVTLDAIMDQLGERSFGPVLLVAGLITAAPLVGDIPGIPTVMGILVALTAGQLLFRRDHIWLPGWMLHRSMDRGKVCKAVVWMRPVARVLDRWSKPRMNGLLRRGGVHLVAGACLAIAVAMPLMEVVPFSANVAGAALTIFGLALIARDGLMALIALVATVLTLGAVAYGVLG